MVSTHLKNISQNGNLPQIGLKIKNIWNHHLVIFQLSIFRGYVSFREGNFSRLRSPNHVNGLRNEPRWLGGERPGEFIRRWRSFVKMRFFPGLEKAWRHAIRPHPKKKVVFGVFCYFFLWWGRVSIHLKSEIANLQIFVKPETCFLKKNSTHKQKRNFVQARKILKIVSSTTGSLPAGHEICVFFFLEPEIFSDPSQVFDETHMFDRKTVR